MSELRVASRYAKAVMDLAIEQKVVEAVEKDMRLVVDTIADNEVLNEVLASPVLKTSEKVHALSEIFKGTSPLSQQLFSLLAGNKRIGMLEEVANQYLHMYDNMQGQDIATVITAVPLSGPLEKKILKQLEAITGNEVTIENIVDEKLIGGFVLRVGDLEYNASIANNLGNVKRELIQN